MTEFHLLRPLWLAGIPVVAFLVLFLNHQRGRGGVWRDFIDPELAPYLLTRSSDTLQYIGSGTILLAASVVSFALAGPVWEREPVPVFRSESSLVVALDLSLSMNAQDLEPSRLARAKFKIADLVNLRQGGQTALVVFAAQSFVVTPLTDDTATLLSQLRGLDTSIMPLQGSEPATAMKLAGELLSQAGALGGHTLIVTDGIEPDALDALKDTASELDLPVSILGIGSDEGAPIPDANGGFAKDDRGEIIVSALNHDALKKFATESGGIYLDLETNDEEIRRLQNFLDLEQMNQSQQLDDLAAEQWREFGPWLLLCMLPVAALAFRRGALFLVICLINPLVSEQAQADWWRTDDQAASKAYEQGDFSTAAKQFQHRDWRATANYRSGDYASALSDFAESDTPDGHYNRGNALARLGRLEEAIAAYDRALEGLPGDADTLHNKALLESLLEQQQSPPDQSQQGEKKDGEQKQSEQQQGSDDSNEQQQGGGQQDQEANQGLSDGNSMGGSEQQNESEPKTEDQSKHGQQAQQSEQEDSDSDGESENMSSVTKESSENASESDTERALATEQWLRQIPDDPAGLLRRKFLYQYKKHYGSESYEGNRW